MNTIQTTGRLTLVALAVFVATGALADDVGWYGGASVGASKATIDDTRITNSLLGSGFNSATITDDNRGTGYKIFGGYQVNQNLALEGGYFDLGKFGFSANTVPTGVLNGNLRLRGIHLDAVGLLPVTDKFSVLGRVGAHYAQTRDNFSGTGAVGVTNPYPSKYDTNLKVGLGVQYAFSEALALRAEIERYRINDAVGNKGDIDLLSVGLVYRFGGKTPSPVVRTAMPEPVLMAQAPQPLVVPPVPPPAPTPPPAPQKVSFEADSFFGFDQATLQPSGQQALDTFVVELKSTRIDAFTVTGHTDRIGSAAYNRELSTRRAETVSRYLVGAGITPAIIKTQGLGKTNPVTQPGDCTGRKVTPKLVACLQPDRRVDIEVSGTK